MPVAHAGSHTVYPLPWRFQRNTNMATTEGHYRLYPAILLTTSSVIKHIFGSRFLPFVCCNDDAAALQTGFQELTERRIADRQPAAFYHSTLPRLFSAGTERRQRNTPTVNWLPIPGLNLPRYRRPSC